MNRRFGRGVALSVVIGELALRSLPLPVACELMARTTVALGPKVLKLRKMRRNFATAFPELDDGALDAVVRRAMANFGRLLAEIAHMRSFRDGRRGAELHLHGRMPQPLGPRGNAIFVGAHLGNWEVVPFLLARHGHRLTIVQTPVGDRLIDARLMAGRRLTGATYVEKVGATRACAAALKRGESLALLADSRVDHGVEAVFFGQRTRFTDFPARMALRFGCPIVVMDCWRARPGRIEVAFHEPIRPEDFTGPEARQEMTQRMVTAMEETIRRHPDQWFCNKRRFAPPSRKADQDGGTVSALAERAAESSATG